MNLNDVQKQLVAADVPEFTYCLTGGLPSEAFCIEQQRDGRWRTYYSERGGRSDLQVFETEDEACCFFLKELLPK